MDPITLSLLIAGGAGLASSIGKASSNNGAQKYNREQLDELLNRKAQGNLGLAGNERQLLDQQLNAPVAAAAAAGQQRAEQIAAASGMSSGADQARLRQESTAVRAAGAQQAALAISQADMQKKQQQLNEIEQRQALKSASRQDDTDAVMTGAAQIAAPIDSLAGASPATLKLAGLFGSSLDSNDKAQVAAFAKQHPEEFASMLSQFLNEQE